VAAHRGLLWYEPGPGGIGSNFILELPVSAQGGEGGSGDIPGPYGDRNETATTARPSRHGLVTVATPRQGIHSMATLTGAMASAAEPRAKDAPSGVTGVAMTPLHREDDVSNAGPAQGPSRSLDPSGAAPTAKATSVDREKAAGEAKPRILALDDEPSIRAFLRTALSRHGMDCQPFPDGAHALEGLREANFDVMLIDHRMPLMSGTEFYEAAIAFRPELATRAIFMSGDVLNPDLRGFATQRSIRLLAKPFDIDAVIRIVREALEANKIGDD
jgi:CheY-like chemotaxis protein